LGADARVFPCSDALFEPTLEAASSLGMGKVTGVPVVGSNGARWAKRGYAWICGNDGSMDDPVDGTNLSLGSLYGQREDSTSAAAQSAVRAGERGAGRSEQCPRKIGGTSRLTQLVAAR
jgi:hypothetical protein